MHREGHIGAALLAYAPLAAVTAAVGFPTVAAGGGVVAVALAMLPDWDMKLPGVTHRGVTHTLRFAAVVGAGAAAFGVVFGLVLPEFGLLETAAIAGYLGTVGALTVASHIAADALTPMGVEPWGDDGPHISYGVCRADSTLGNYGLLALGLTLAVVGFNLGLGFAGAAGLA